MPEIKWNVQLYDEKHAFVSKLGEDLLEWLDPQPGERILDLGCGTGQLSAEIAGFGAAVRGLDFSVEMIERAKATHPQVRFDVQDARNFQYEEKFDAIFSNAALHWIQEQREVIASMHKALKSRGRLIFEFGGKGNVDGIVQAIKIALAEAGKKIGPGSWYFPSIGEYSAMLEAQGFEVITALLFDRETAMVGQDGMKNWIQMFGGFYFQKMKASEKELIIDRAVELLRPTHYRRGGWYGDYRRLRMKAVKK